MELEVTKLSLTEWISITQNKDIIIPITLHTTSGSMLPVIRIKEDTVIVIPCELKDAHIGDIVLIRKLDTSAGVVLHRLYRIKNGKIITLGDNMRQPDNEENVEMLLGRAISITGPRKNIDCESRLQRILGKIIVYTYRLRPIIFFMRRVFCKLDRVIRKTKAHG